MILVSTLTFLALVVAGAMWGHHGGDPAGTTTGGLPDYLGATGSTGNGVPVSQSGLNALANETGHLRISINFTWVLLTGFLVLFMQVGFAFLVTGLTRAKNAGHMMMMNLAVVRRSRCSRTTRSDSRSMFGGVAPVANLGGLSPLTGIFGHGSAGVIGTHGFFLQTGNGYDVGVMALFLFQVVFMETAGYIIIGAIAERISFAGVHPRRDRDGRDHLSDLRHVDVGRRLARPPRPHRCISATARSTSPAPAWSTPPAAGRRSRWR